MSIHIYANRHRNIQSKDTYTYTFTGSTDTYIDKYTYTRTDMYIDTYTYKDTCTYIVTDTYTDKYMNTRTDTYTYIQRHKHLHSLRHVHRQIQDTGWY